MPLENKGLEIGQTAPNWELLGLAGEKVSLSQFRGRPLLLLFFRGTWCPSCRKQMEHFRDQWSRIEPLAQVVGIVGQDAQPVRDFLSRNPLPYPLLPDPDRQVIQLHNVYQRFSLTGFKIAHPTTLIIDGSGIVRYCYVGDSQFDRPDLEAVIRELESLSQVRA
jgi:peroxiredoxin Q/BCP